jgi:hypothetical protein
MILTLGSAPRLNNPVDSAHSHLPGRPVLENPIQILKLEREYVKFRHMLTQCIYIVSTEDRWISPYRCVLSL